jgi:hypothetical protein
MKKSKPLLTLPMICHIANEGYTNERHSGSAKLNVMPHAADERLEYNLSLWLPPMKDTPARLQMNATWR